MELPAVRLEDALQIVILEQEPERFRARGGAVAEPAAWWSGR
jgi:hypothetical protein